MVAPLEIRLAVPLPPIHLMHLGVALLDQRWSVALAEPHWRLYHNRSRGGAMRFAGPGMAMTARDGAVVLIPPWCRVTATCSGPVDHVFLHLDRVPLPEPWVREHLTAPRELPPDSARDAVLDAFRAAPLGPLPMGLHLQLLALVPTCLAALVASLPPVAQEDLDRAAAGLDPLTPALARLEADLAAPLDLATLATACGLSPTRFAHRFRERLGTTPGRWLQARRIAEAAGLLATGDLPIEAVATTVGFANRFHFSRIFARQVGEGPAAYRSRRQHARVHRLGPVSTIAAATPPAGGMQKPQHPP